MIRELASRTVVTPHLVGASYLCSKSLILRSGSARLLFG